MRDAGLKESGRFSVDQMAKWLCKMPMPGTQAGHCHWLVASASHWSGVDYSANDLSLKIADIKARYQLAEGSQQEVTPSESLPTFQYANNANPFPTEIKFFKMIELTHRGLGDLVAVLSHLCLHQGESEFTCSLSE